MKLVDSTPIRSNITVELTPYEQDVLMAITGRIGGDPTGHRKVSDSLREILINAGAAPVAIPDSAGGRSQSIYFAYFTEGNQQ